MTKVDLTPAYLLHRRAYKDNSLLLDFLTLEHGKIRLVARSARKSKTSMQMFMKLNISFSGKVELKSLNNWEVDDTPRLLTGERLIFAMYANELIDRLLHEYDPHFEIFHAYKQFIENLSTIDTGNQQWLLRIFENMLLDDLGYGLNFDEDINNKQVELSSNYTYIEQQGFKSDAQGIISGNLLKQLSLQDLNNIPNKDSLKICRNLNRMRLSPLLGSKPLKSRELYIK